jgi:hypothetical protein
VRHSALKRAYFAIRIWFSSVDRNDLTIYFLWLIFNNRRDNLRVLVGEPSKKRWDTHRELVSLSGVESRGRLWKSSVIVSTGKGVTKVTLTRISGGSRWFLYLNACDGPVLLDGVESLKSMILVVADQKKTEIVLASRYCTLGIVGLGR